MINLTARAPARAKRLPEGDREAIGSTALREIESEHRRAESCAQMNRLKGSRRETEVGVIRPHVEAVASILLAFLAFGCDPGVDSWSHHVSDRRHYDGGSPTASPDGSKVVYSTPATGHGDLYTVSRGVSKRLTSSTDFEAHPVYSPTGEKIAYKRENGGYSHVWIMNPDGSNQTKITSGQFFDDPLSFSADGKRIFFQRGFPTVGLARSSLDYVMDLDGTNVGQVPRTPPPTHPWEYVTPDKTRIIAFGPYAVSKVKVLDGRSGRGLETLNVPSGARSNPSRSYDGRSLYFSLMERDADDVSTPRGNVDDVSVFRIDLDDVSVQRIK